MYDYNELDPAGMDRLRAQAQHNELATEAAVMRNLLSQIAKLSSGPREVPHAVTLSDIHDLTKKYL